MSDPYKYQAVNNKPLDDKDGCFNNTKNSNGGEESKLVIDYDSDVVVINEDFMQIKDDEFLAMRRQALDSIKKELESLNVADAEKSFDKLCSSLKDLTYRLKKLVFEEGSYVEKDTLVQLLITTVKNVNSVFSSINQTLKDQN